MSARAALLVAVLGASGISQVVLQEPAGAAAADSQLGAMAKFIGQQPVSTFSPATAASRSFLKTKLTLAKAQVLVSGCGDAISLIQIVEGAITSANATVRIVGATAPMILNQMLNLEAAVRGTQTSHTCGPGTAGSVAAPSTVETKVVGADLGHVTFSLLLPDTQFGPPGFTADQAYIAVTAPGAGRAAGLGLGQPDLPAAPLLVAIPQGTFPRVSITSSTSYTMTLPHPVAPLESSDPAAITDGSSLPTNTSTFVLDQQAYASAEAMPTLVADPPTTSQRGLELTSISVPMVRYTPSLRQVEVLKTATVEVTFCGTAAPGDCVPNGQSQTGGPADSAATFGDSSLTDASNAAFVNLWQSEVANWSQVSAANLPVTAPLANCGEQMMLITPSFWKASAVTYAADRTAHGVVTKVFSTDDIGATTGGIHDAIAAEMTAPCRTKPSFVLLFGRTEFIPTFEVTLPYSYWEIGNPPAGGCPGGAPVASDQPYGFIHQWGSVDPSAPGLPDSDCRTQADLHPDLFIGRLITPTPVLYVMEDYIDAPPKVASLYKRVTGAQKFESAISNMAASDANTFCADPNNAATTATAIHPFIESSEFVGMLAGAAGKSFNRVSVADTCPGVRPTTNSDGFPLPAPLLLPAAWSTNSASTALIVGAVTPGSSIIWHADHGYTDASGWASPALRAADLTYNALVARGGLPPVLWSSDCDSGKFDGGGGFANVVQVTPFSSFNQAAENAGAIAHIGASRESPITESGVLLESMGRALFPEVGNVWKVVFGVPMSKPVEQLGPLLEASKLDLDTRSPSSWGGPLVRLEYNLFGDPSMSIQRDVPKVVSQKKFVVALSDAASGQSSVSVSTTAKLPANSTQVVQAWKDGVLLASAYLNPTTGAAILSDELDGVHPFNGATFTLVGDGVVPVTKVIAGL